MEEENFIKKYPEIWIKTAGIVSESGIERKVRTAITYVRVKVNGLYRFVEVRLDSSFTDEKCWCESDMPRFFREVYSVLGTEINREFHPWESSGILDENQED